MLGAFSLAASTISATGAVTGGTIQASAGIAQLGSDSPEKFEKLGDAASKVSDLSSPGGALGFTSAVVLGKDPMTGAEIGAGLENLGTGVKSIGNLSDSAKNLES